ncbi:MAG: GxxExxY protein [Candidatus Methylacidiphilales bacterium]|nr:GxxExxY protein [Candidatus Methylacidiphilales bacterium]
MNENQIAELILDVAFDIHTEIGPGLLESVYEVLLANLLREKGLHVERQVIIPLNFRGIRFEEAFRADLIINNLVLIEVKTVDGLSKAHKSQVLTYLKLTGLKLGLLINFNNHQLKGNFERIVNGLREDQPDQDKPQQDIYL